jgi:hypothetical protein
MSTDSTTQPETTTVEETPTPSPAELRKGRAEAATRYLDKDRVTPTQFAAYEALLAEGEGSPLEVLGIDREAAEAHASKVKLLPTEDRKRINALMSGLTPSHVWLKAIIATALHLEDEAADRAEAAQGE